MSVKDWCQSQGISDKTYYYWLRKLKQEDFDKLEEQREKLLRKSQTVFYELKKPVSVPASSNTAVFIFKNDIRIEIKNHVDATTVKMVLDLLGQTF